MHRPQTCGNRRLTPNYLTTNQSEECPWADYILLSLSPSGEGNGNPLQYSCLENPVDRGAWWAAVHGVAQSGTQLKWLSSSSSSFLPQFNSVLSHVWLFVTPLAVAQQASLSITNSRSLPKHVHWVGDAIQSSHPLLSFSLTVSLKTVHWKPLGSWAFELQLPVLLAWCPTIKATLSLTTTWCQ